MAVLHRAISAGAAARLKTGVRGAASNECRASASWQPYGSCREKRMFA